MSASVVAALRVARRLGLVAFLLTVAPAAWAAPFAYVANFLENSVTVIDTATNTQITTIPVGVNPFGVAVTPDGAKVYVGNFAANSVSVINASANAVVATIPVGSQPRGLVAAPDGSKVYVANAGGTTVSVIDTATNTVVSTVTVGGSPYGLAATPDGSKVYVANAFDNTVSVIATATNTVTATIAVGTYPLGLAVTPDGKKVYVTHNLASSVSVIDTALGMETATLTVSANPFGAAVTPDGKKVYVTSPGTDSVSVIATATNAVSTVALASGAQPNGVAVTPDGSRVYVADVGTNNVSVIDTGTDAVAGTVAVGNHPISFGQFIGLHAPASPGLSATFTPNFPVIGHPVVDKATLTGGASPTGTMTFKVFSNGDTTCSSPLFTSSVPVSGNGNYSSTAFTPTAIGAYQWTVSYSGDVNNAPASVPCGTSGQLFIVGMELPTLTASATPTSTTVGSAVGDTAKLKSGYNPTGTLTFTLFGAGDTTCSSTPAFTNVVTVSGNGNYTTSATFAPTAVGTYRWTVSYSGDVNNAPASTTCNAGGENVDVTAATPTLTAATNPGSTPLGNPVGDTATLSSGVNPTGTMTFSLYGIGDTTCSSPPLFTSTVIVSGNGSYDASSFTPSAAGTYFWTASYSGDANNVAASVACGTSGQSVDVGKADQAIVFGTAPSVTVGGSGTVTATGGASGNPVVFGTTSAASICAVSSTGTVSGVGAGNCIVTANQAGNANYNDAPQVTQTVAIGQASQTITFTSTPPANAIVGGSYTVGATAASGLSVTFSIDALSTANACTVGGNVVSFTGAGTCVIDANQPGDANYSAAPQVQQSIAVGQAGQTITFTSTPPANAIVGGSYTVGATATSGLSVTFSIDVASTANACTISGNVVSFTGAGNCIIDANQSGDANHSAAPQGQQAFAIGAAPVPTPATPAPTLSTWMAALLAALLGLMAYARTRRA